MRSLATIALALALSGCLSVPQLKSDGSALTAADLDLSAAAPLATINDHWWTALGDTQLDELVERALSDNPSLAQARARLSTAQEQAELAGANARPQLAFDAAPEIQRYSEHYIIPPPLGGTTKASALIAVNFAWDLDFWGRHAALIAAAGASADAASADLAAARLALIDAVVRSYIQLHRAQELRRLALREIKQRESVFSLTEKRVSAGLDTRVELAQATGALPQARIDLAQAEETIVLVRYQLAVLSGEPATAGDDLRPAELEDAAALLPPDRIPADLLGRRPDVVAARARITAASSARDAARAQFYPNVNLTAFAGTAAIGLNELLDAGSRAYGTGAALHLPLFDAGRLRANFRVRHAELDQAIASYNTSVLGAVQEAASQLASLRSVEAQRELQQEAMGAAEDAYRLAQRRYDAGLANYLSVLSTETQVLAQRRQGVELNARRYELSIGLIRAVGGGYDIAPTALSAKDSQ